MFDQDDRQLASPVRSLLAFCLLAAACADDLLPNPDRADGGAVNPGVSSKSVEDTVETTIDATRSDAWVYLDFEENRESIVADPAASRAWDLGFQRFKIKSNGGISGAAGVEVAVVPDGELSDISAAPAMGWQVDQPDGADMNPDPDTVFNRGEETWFDYDPASHMLAARKRVYVVRTADDGYFAVQILKYYDQAGTAGVILFRWKKVAAPAGRVPAALAPLAAGSLR